MRVSYKRTAIKDMETTRDYIAGRLKNPKAAKKMMTALLKAISLLAEVCVYGNALFPANRTCIWVQHWQRSLKSPRMCAILWWQSS